VAPTGLGAGPLLTAVREGAPLGQVEEVATMRGHTVGVRVARVPVFDREAHLSARALRRMGEVSQIWTIACLRARADAGLSGDAASAHRPERRGTYMGTGFGCIDATWDYLLPVLRAGAGDASPFLFSESVANAPAGHSAIEIDTRGASFTFTCGDASALVAVSRAADAVRTGRVDVAWAGGIDLMVPPLVHVLALLGVPFLGEGAACFVVEEAEAAARRGARALAEIAGGALLSDPLAGANRWSRDAAAYERCMRRALGATRSPALDPGSGEVTAPATVREPEPSRVESLFLHAATDSAARQAEADAAASVCPGTPVTHVTDVTGMFGACGGFALAAATAAHCTGDRLVTAASWGGALASVRLSSPV